MSTVMNRIGGELPIGGSGWEIVVRRYERDAQAHPKLEAHGLVLANILAAAEAGTVRTLEGPGLLTRKDEQLRQQALHDGAHGPDEAVSGYLRSALRAMSDKGRGLFPDLCFMLDMSAEVDTALADLRANEPIVRRLREQLGRNPVEVRADGLTALYSRLVEPLEVLEPPEFLSLPQWLDGTGAGGNSAEILGSWLTDAWTLWTAEEVGRAFRNLAEAGRR
jgi:hypothetical protein